MNNAKPFSWTVRLTVAPLWVADGFSLCNERALAMLSAEVSHANIDSELEVEVLEAPSPQAIAKVQGYIAKTAAYDEVVQNLKQGTPEAGVLLGALRDARKLLDSVAFVAVEGDTLPVLEKLNAALNAIYARQGAAMPVDA
jgi:hypothetical protein